MKYQYSVSVVCPLSPRQDSGWHIDRYPTMSGTERRAIGGGRLARKMEPVIEGHYLYSKCLGELQQRFTTNGIRQEVRQPCQATIRCRKSRLGLVARDKREERDSRDV